MHSLTLDFTNALISPPRLQSLAHFLFHLDIYELDCVKDLNVATAAMQSSVFMLVMINGANTISDAMGKLVSETRGNSCTLCYLTAGAYNWRFAAGQHKMMLFTINEQYIKQRCDEVPELKLLGAAIESAAAPSLVLPHCSVAESISNLVNRQLNKISGSLTKDAALHHIITGSLDKYQRALITGQYDPLTFDKMKAAEIINFIHQHFRAQKCDDLKTLSNQFNMSKSKFKILIKRVVDRSLFQYVLKLRMVEAMVQLLSTKKSIKDIGNEVGYPNPSHFSRVFKSYYHKMPKSITRL